LYLNEKILIGPFITDMWWTVWKTGKNENVGMHYTTCAITMERKLKSLRGVIDAQVSLASESADIVYDPGKVSMKEIVRAVRDVGYDVYKEKILLAVKDLKGVEIIPSKYFLFHVTKT